MSAAPCIRASSSAPTILASHSLSTWLSQAPKRSAPGQLGGRCTVGSDTVGGLSLGRRDLTLPGSAHPALGRNTVHQEQAPTMLGSDLTGTLTAGSEPLAPGPTLLAPCPAEGQGTKTWWPRRQEPSDVRLLPSCLPPAGLEYFCLSCPLTTFDPFVPAKLGAVGVPACSD